MSDRVYTGKNDDRHYHGEAADVTYNLARCIHAEECIHRLRAVFDATRRPWIMPDAAPADDLAVTIVHCPSGALHIERKDGGADEMPLAENRARLWADGPIQLQGDLAIHGAGTAVEAETRATLCRCGASRHKPFCDNTHRTTGFTAAEAAPIEVVPALPGGRLVVTAEPNGPYHVVGSLIITNADGEYLYAGEETWLCRCGGSSHKPFCDSTHETNGFTAE